MALSRAVAVGLLVLAFPAWLPDRTRSPARRVPGVPRAVLPALVHLVPRAGDAAVHPETRAGEARRALGEIPSGGVRYRADFGGDTGWIVETGPKGERKYRIDHAMGGKNVFYFLTPLERGRLQVSPRLRRAAEGVVPDHRQPPAPLFDNAPSLPWTDPSTPSIPRATGAT